MHQHNVTRSALNDILVTFEAAWTLSSKRCTYCSKGPQKSAAAGSVVVSLCTLELKVAF